MSSQINKAFEDFQKCFYESEPREANGTLWSLLFSSLKRQTSLHPVQGQGLGKPGKLYSSRKWEPTRDFITAPSKPLNFGRQAYALAQQQSTLTMGREAATSSHTEHAWFSDWEGHSILRSLDTDLRSQEITFTRHTAIIIPTVEVWNWSSKTFNDLSKDSAINDR